MHDDPRNRIGAEYAALPLAFHPAENPETLWRDPTHRTCKECHHVMSCKNAYRLQDDWKRCVHPFLLDHRHKHTDPLPRPETTT